MPPSPYRLLAVVLATTFALAVAVQSGRAEVAKWDSERVAKIAEELAVNAGDLREQVRKVPGQNYATLQEKARKRLLDTLRVLRNEARHLASEVKAGAGQEDTFPVYERLGNLARDARESANRIFLPEPVLDALTSASVTWSKLTPYYDPDWEREPASTEAR